VCELINQYLIDNGGESRLWRGIEQQVCLHTCSINLHTC
jgi:hypothetical protein